MAAFADATQVNIFKTRYADQIADLIPREMHLSRDIPFSQTARVGANYVAAAILSAETGWTLADGLSAAVLNSPRSGTVKQATINAATTTLSSVVPWSSFSRSSGGDEVAFIEATKYIVKNNLKSHERLQETLRIYANSYDQLGYVSYYTGVYDNVSWTNGSGTINGITFSGGISTTPVSGTQYAVLFEPGQFAAGHWVGNDGNPGCAVYLINNVGSVVASGSLVKVYTDYHYIVVDFGGSVPPSATAEYSPLQIPASGTLRVCFQGMEFNSSIAGTTTSSAYVGIQRIMGTQTGSLFGITVDNYSLWQSSVFNCNGQYLSFDMIQKGLGQTYNHSGVEGDIKIYLNPNAWARLAVDQASLRMYDSSYKVTRAENGFKELRYESQTGSASLVSHRCVKEGEAFGLFLSSWVRGGSAEISMTVPGSNVPIIYPLESQQGFKFNSYSDQFLFCNMPAANIYWYNANVQSPV
jgi:hypothetical protein